MEINNHHLCIGCMNPLHDKTICSYCGLEQKGYKPIPRCLIPGTRLQERYILGKVLGEGNFGITYIGYDVLLEMPVAIKEYYPADLVSRDMLRGNDQDVYLYSTIEQAEYDKRLEKFLGEARNLTRFNNLNAVVTVRDFFYANHTAYMVMDYVSGESLKSYIARTGAMSGGEVLKMFRPVIEALEKIHETGMIHRDISPDNLLIDEDGELVLIDFGAAELGNVELTKTLTITFKRGFSPEEQYRSLGKLGAWTDIYALCATMYYAMTAKAPDEAIQRTIEDRIIPLWEWKNIDLSVIQMKAIMKGMEVRAEDRVQSASELSHFLYDESETVLHKEKTRKPFAYLIAGVLLLVICGLTAGVIFLKNGSFDADSGKKVFVTESVKLGISTVMQKNIGERVLLEQERVRELEKNTTEELQSTTEVIKNTEAPKVHQNKKSNAEDDMDGFIP